MNKIIMIGRVINDPEAHTTQSGISRSAFRLAVRQRFASTPPVGIVRGQED